MGVASVVAEDPDSASLGELLAALEVKVLCNGELIDEGPVLAGTEECAGEHDRVEGSVILAHELDELDVLVLLLVLPPLLPLWRQVRCY